MHPMKPAKQPFIFWIAGSVLLCSGIPALASGVYNASLAFTMVGVSELICGTALLAVGFVSHRRLRRPPQA